MEFDLAIQKTLRSGGNVFNLHVNIQTQSKRLVISGASGAGKTVLLKAIAGLLKPDLGHISFRGQRLFDHALGINLAPQARKMAYVFQEYALFPHLTVRQNIAFGLTRGWLNPRAQTAAPAVAHWLSAFELDAVAQHYPEQLSGGQRQRTALARALVGSPRALLLDEPFAALDTRLRVHLRRQLGDLLQQLDLPMILITHDDADIHALEGEVIQLREGQRTDQMNDAEGTFKNLVF